MRASARTGDWLMYTEFWGAIAAAVGAALAGWGLDRWLGIRTKIATWLRSVKARKAATEAMVMSWPGFQHDIQASRVQLSAIRSELTANSAATKDIQHEIKIMRATSRARADADPTTGYFECSVDGGNTEANETYCRRMKCGEDDLLGWKYMARIHPDDRDVVEEKWNWARQHRVEYRHKHRMVAMDGGVWLVETRTTPIPPGEEPAAWVGFINFLSFEGIHPELAAL